MSVSRFTRSRFLTPKFERQLFYPQGGGTSYVPASYVLNGTDELLTRVNATASPSPSTVAFTYSIWAKGTFPASPKLLYLLASFADASNVCRVMGSSSNTNNAVVQYNNVLAGTSTATETTDSNAFTQNGTWHHYVIRYDSANGTADSRLIIERDGSVINDTNAVAIGASEAHDMLSNGRTLSIGSLNGVFAGAQWKLGFIDFIEGSVLAASNFAFDNGGTWTRKKYTGAYGTYGFKLDGTDTFNDVSGNAQNFTGTNMDATNLDTADLPPYTN